MAKVVLGISPGTRVIGLSVMRDGELIEWRVRSFKDKWSPRKRHIILSVIAKLCGYYEVNMIALKKVDPTKSSKELDRLIESIIRQSNRSNLAIECFSLDELQNELRRSKKKLAEAVTRRYPELKAMYIKESNNRTEYYAKMFEAIAISELC